MQFLLDACVHRKLLSAMQAQGLSVRHVLDWDAVASDTAVIEYALDQHLVLVTHDKDFTQHAHFGHKPFGAILRISPGSVESMLAVCLDVIARYRTSLESGCVVIASRERVRVIPNKPGNGPRQDQK